MDYTSNQQLLRSLVSGVNAMIPLSCGDFIKGINFDNAATTPPFLSVLSEVNNFAPWYSSVHRGTGYKSKLSSEIFEHARQCVLSFVNADPDKYTVIFVKNTTEALNKLSYKFHTCSKGSVILSTCMEHHSNDLPWRDKCKVDYVATDSLGRLSLDDLEYKLTKYKGHVKLVTATGASNVTGYKNNVHEIAKLAHKFNARICVDGAQLIPHSHFSMKAEDSIGDIDYLAFSAHKMYAPFGVGVLIGLKDTFESGEPDYKGGGTIKIVTHDYIKWDDPPHKEEAGTPNLIGIAALMASINTLNAIGLENIEKHEQILTEYALQKLKAVPDIKLYGNTSDASDRVGIIPFNIDGVYHGVVASILSDEGGIAVRNGCFCSQPYIQRLLNVSDKEMQAYIKNPTPSRPGMVRISFGLYNTFEEIDTLVTLLHHISLHKEMYLDKYGSLK